jgi:DNA mismatch repair protein MSH5
MSLIAALKAQLDYVSKVGFLVSLEGLTHWNTEISIPEDFVFVFSEGDKSFFKNIDVQHLDETIGDLDAFIKDTENLILGQLEEEILDFESQILESFNALADLDCILAFADCAADLKYVRPKILPKDENCIEIVNGRHPLQEIVLESDFRPNNTTIEPCRRVHIISGPNFSGKSCYARQVGLLVFMAHIGCFIPCDDAKISITDQIIARFSGFETCSVPQSSFQLSLTQMGHTIRYATSNSLVIIDEFGKGTSPASGIALLTAAIQTLGKQNCKVICTTHFIEMFTMGLLRDGEDGLKAMQMTVHFPECSTDSIEPLFALEEGIATSSAGLACAQKAGVKKVILERASEIINSLKERRKIQPMVEIAHSNTHFPISANPLLRNFFDTNWTTSSDLEIENFMSVTFGSC